MSKKYFSLILHTNGDRTKLESIFKTSDPQTELIIIDSLYNEQTQTWIGEQETEFYNIVYAPVIEASHKYAHDYNQALNTAILFSENGWIIKVDELLEFKEDAFDIIRADLDSFNEVLSSDRFVIIGQELKADSGHQRWQDTFSPTEPQRYLDLKNPNVGSDIIMMPIELIYALNGFDCRYDLGYGLSEVQLLHRALVLQYKLFLDRSLMGYRESEQKIVELDRMNQITYQLEMTEINAGKIRAFNSIDLLGHHPSFLAQKEKYLITK